MDRQELIDNLGTIARSGTRAFIEPPGRSQGRHRADRPIRRRLLFGLHGGRPHRGDKPPRRRRAKRGCGARRAAVVSRSSPATADQAARVPRGTEVVLHLKPEAKRYLEAHEIERIVRTYSDHILFPIELVGGKDEPAPDQRRERALAAPQIRDRGGGLHAGLPHDRRRVRRAGHDAALPGRGPPVLRRAAVRAVEPALRSVRSRRARAA